MDGEEIYACMDETSCNALYMHVFGYIPVGWIVDRDSSVV
jgi:hypothetical protein